MKKLTKKQQIKRIKEIFKNEHMVKCETCGLVYLPMSELTEFNCANCYNIYDMHNNTTNKEEFTYNKDELKRSIELLNSAETYGVYL